MDNSIPAGAAHLLNFIYKTEVSREAPECYEVIYGHNQIKLTIPLTQMTLGEIQAVQSTWSKRFGSSATGAAQFMKATLAGLISELGLLLSTKFTGDLQDRLAYHLLKRRGYTAFMNGEITRTEFGKRLAQEWASFPVLASTTGGSRSVTRGQSYYAGDGLNKSLVTPTEVEAILEVVRKLGNVVPVAVTPPVTVDPIMTVPVVVIGVPELPPLPEVPEIPKVTEVVGSLPSTQVTVIVIVVTSLVTGLTATNAWLLGLPCQLLGLACGN